MNEDYNNYYDWKNYQIRYDVIRIRMIRIKNDMGYSKKLVCLLERMLERDEFIRIGVSKLTQELGVNFYRESYTVDREDEIKAMQRGAIGGGNFTKNLTSVKN